MLHIEVKVKINCFEQDHKNDISLVNNHNRF